MAVRNRFFENIEVLVPGVAGGQTQQKYNFPDEPQIRNTPILSIVVYSINTMTLSPLTFQPLPSVAILKTAYLSLYTTDPNSGEQKYGIDNLPLLELNYMQQGAAGNAEPHVIYMPEFVGQTVTWPKSFITLAAPPNNTTNFVFLLGVRYSWTKKVQQ